MLRRIDQMVAVIVAAMLLAIVLPAVGPARGVAQSVANVAVFILFFLYGLRLSRRDVLSGLGNVRLLAPLVVWVFGVMTIAGWALWQLGLSFLPPALALGFVFLGVMPSTIQSATVYTSLAGGNVATSVVAAAVVNILGVFVSAPLFALIAGSHGPAFDNAGLVKVATMLLLPFALGQALQGLAGGWVKNHRGLVMVLDRSSIGIAVYVAFSGAVEQDIWDRIDAAAWIGLGAGCALLLALGYGGGWLVGGALRLAYGDRVAFLFGAAQKSIAMGAPLATVLLPPASAGIILLPLLVYHLAQMVVAAPIAARLRRGTQV